jgi:hypothetical protein
MKSTKTPPSSIVESLLNNKNQCTNLKSQSTNNNEEIHPDEPAKNQNLLPTSAFQQYNKILVAASGLAYGHLEEFRAVKPEGLLLAD